jgi:hypothetical protein
MDEVIGFEWVKWGFEWALLWGVWSLNRMSICTTTIWSSKINRGEPTEKLRRFEKEHNLSTSVSFLVRQMEKLIDNDRESHRDPSSCYLGKLKVRSEVWIKLSVYCMITSILGATNLKKFKDCECGDGDLDDKLWRTVWKEGVRIKKLRCCVVVTEE